MRSIVCLAIAFVLFFQSQPASACLRPELDERAIQWSPIIVKANLVSAKDPASIKLVPLGLVVSTWKITEVFDGPLKVDAEITVYSFVPTLVAGEPMPNPCAEMPPAGKSRILLLRPAKECTFAQRKDVLDLPGDAYCVVQHVVEEDINDDAVKDLKQKIATVRKAEAAYSEKEAALQAETLVNAVDDTEADHADAALLDMGPKALPAMKATLAKTTGPGKNRLERIIDELSPPPADTGKKEKHEVTSPPTPAMP